ncbi:M28 family metallopeptidase [Ascidiimonas aurantiaca]|uniref:M28 family metallopeptidase n=1 Tax=Ascidiimonas aurantiaca TaxID=1685432 RepID=UPI0030ECD49F
MKNYLLTFVFALLLIACKSSTGVLRPESVLKDAKGESNGVAATIKTVPTTSVTTIMNYLASDDLEGRDTGTKGIELAATYIEDIFKENGVMPYFETYKDTLSNFKKVAYNVVGVVEGNDPKLKDEFIVIGAHYDHIGFAKNVNGDSIANGANDNASGTTAVVEIAKYFGKQKSNKRSLLFVLFSAEEKGLLGSYHLAKKLKAQNFSLYTMVNFEMVGVPLTGKDYLAYVTGYEKSNMAEKFNEYTGKKTLGYLPTAKEYNLFQRSDNYPFYQEFKVPSQTICTFDFTNFDYYHHVDDEVGQMNMAHIAYLTNEIIPALEKMAGTRKQEIQMNE